MDEPLWSTQNKDMPCIDYSDSILLCYFVLSTHLECLCLGWPYVYTHTRGLQRDVVHLGWLMAPSYMRSNFIFNLWVWRMLSILHRLMFWPWLAFCPASLEESGPAGVMGTEMVGCLPPPVLTDRILAGAAQWEGIGNSSCWYILNVYNQPSSLKSRIPFCTKFPS